MSDVNSPLKVVWRNEQKITARNVQHKMTEDEAAYLGLILWPEMPPQSDKPFSVAGAVQDAIERQEKKGTLLQSVKDFVSANAAITQNSAQAAIQHVYKMLLDFKKFGIDLVESKEEPIYAQLNDVAPADFIAMGRANMNAARHAYRKD